MYKSYQHSKAHEHEAQQRPPVHRQLHKAYVLLLEGVYHVTRLNELAEQLHKDRDESAVEVARSSLVMGAACLDASIKQACIDCLPLLVQQDNQVGKQLHKKYIKRLNRADPGVEELINELVSNSLQSVDELRKVHQILRINFSPNTDLHDAFGARNEIVHEMDTVTPLPELEFDQDGKLLEQQRRRERNVHDLEQWSHLILETAHTTVRHIDYRLECLAASFSDDH